MLGDAGGRAPDIELFGRFDTGGWPYHYIGPSFRTCKVFRSQKHLFEPVVMVLRFETATRPQQEPRFKRENPKASTALPLNNPYWDLWRR